jgi:hypothetical protein
MLGYGLACYAWLRQDRSPAWARYLDTNPRFYLQHGLSYLSRAAADGGFPSAT